MAALLGLMARRIGRSVLQRAQAAVTSPAAAEERRRLVPRRMYTTEKGGREESIGKWHERGLRFKRIDSQFTQVLHSVTMVYCVYAILACGDSPPWPIRKYTPKWGEEEEEEGAQTNKKQEE